MKSKFLIPLIITCTLFTLQSQAQFTFSVGTGFQQNSGTFGYKFKKFVPQIGIQAIHGGANMTENGQRNDTSTGIIIPYEDNLKFSGTIYLPSIGLKYFFMETDKLNAYGVFNFTKLIVSAKIDDSNDPKANEDLQKQLKKVKIFGGQLGFGTEYFFDPHFSVGGEFGLMMIHLRFKDQFDNVVFDPITGNDVTTQTKQDFKFNLSPTYGRMALNFYFGK